LTKTPINVTVLPAFADDALDLVIDFF
jgi:hypothetical protein